MSVHTLLLVVLVLAVVGLLPVWPYSGPWGWPPAGIVVVVLLVLLLAGCGSMGLYTPQTVGERIDYGYGIGTAVIAAAGDGVASGRLSKDDGRYVLKAADNAWDILKGADAAVNLGDAVAAQDRLTLALSILTELQKFLNQKQVKVDGQLGSKRPQSRNLPDAGSPSNFAGIPASEARESALQF